MKKSFGILLVLLIIISNLGLFASCADSVVSVSIDSNNLGVEISDDMYGIFLEDISYAGDGGLVSNLVSNNSFEYTAAPTSNWKIEDLSATVENKNSMSQTNSNYLKVESSVGGTILNLGYVEYYNYLTEKYNEDKMNTPDMGFKINTSYDFSCYIKNVDFEGSIEVKLYSSSNDGVESLTVPSKNSDWEKVGCTLNSKATEDGGLLIGVTGSGTFYIDFVSLVSEDSYGYDNDEWKYVSLRSDLYQALEDLSPSFIRFPGGCLAEGDSLDNLYSWKNTIGALEDRVQTYNLWNDDENGKTYNNTNAMGYHEYFQLCEDLDAEALPILNVGMICQFEANYNKMLKSYNKGEMTDEEWESYLDTVALRPGTDAFDDYVQDILDLIEYANGDSSTEWGAIRAANGHEEPFDIKYIGLGNENWGELYWRNFDAIYSVIKEKCPNITIISSAGYWFEDEQKDEAWKTINSKYSDTIVDEHYYTSDNLLFKNNDMYDDYNRDGAKVFVGEYAATCQLFGKYITKNNLWAAIEEASYMTGLERNGDIVKMASYAPTFAKINSQCWDENMIWFDSQNIVLTPNYYNQMLFSNNIGTQVVNTDFDSRGCYSTTTINTTEQVIYFKIVNTNSTSISINLDVSNFGNVNCSSMQYISDSSKAACNELSSTTIVPKQIDCTIDNNIVSTKVDGYSINIVRIYYGENDGSGAYQLPKMIDTMEQNVTKYTNFYITLEAVIAVSVIVGSILIGIVIIIVLWYLRKKGVINNQ